MKKVAILGSTGSIGKQTIDVIRKNKKKFKILLLTANKNHNLLSKQIKEFNVKNVIVSDQKSYSILKKKFKNIKIYNDLNKIDKIIPSKFDYTMSAISGFYGLKPTIKIIKKTKTIAIANKESIICGWNLIKRQLKKYNTKFIPVDSEHFSIWSVIKNINSNLIDQIIITASGGPFLNKSVNQLKKANVRNVINHPNWSMGKKISTDSASMMNKVFEVIEASKIFELDIKRIKIIVHPKSIIHAVVVFKNGLIKVLIHDTSMEIPIFNILFNNRNINFYNRTDINFQRLNGINFIEPDKRKFPYINILKKKITTNTYFEIILVTINDELVKLFLKKKISFVQMQNLLIKSINSNIFKKFYQKYPKNINDIHIMADKVKKYLYENEKIFK